jgi:hypothetical protein
MTANGVASRLLANFNAMQDRMQGANGIIDGRVIELLRSLDWARVIDPQTRRTILTEGARTMYMGLPAGAHPNKTKYIALLLRRRDVASPELQTEHPITIFMRVDEKLDALRRIYSTMWFGQGNEPPTLSSSQPAFTFTIAGRVLDWSKTPEQASTARIFTRTWH